MLGTFESKYVKILTDGFHTKIKALKVLKAAETPIRSVVCLISLTEMNIFLTNYLLKAQVFQTEYQAAQKP